MAKFGVGSKHSEEAKAKISASLKARYALQRDLMRSIESIVIIECPDAATVPKSESSSVSKTEARIGLAVVAVMAVLLIVWFGVL